jgi:hypothetical protein
MKLRVPPVALWFALSGCAASCLIAATAAPAAASTYTMTDLGSLGYGVSRGFGINAGGEVVGISYTNKTVQVPCGRHICTVHIADPFSWTAG